MVRDNTALSDEDGSLVGPHRHENEPYDPVLDSIFSALGVDESYLDIEAPRDDTVDVHMSSQLLDSAPRAGADTKPWILHVDDDTDFSNVLKMRLEAHGVSVVQACGGIDGIRHAFTKPADAIILDYEMPRGNGEYVLRRLKQCEATKRIPIIVLTGRRDQGLAQQMLNLGADRFLNKPVRLESMLDELRHFVPLQSPHGEGCLLL